MRQPSRGSGAFLDEAIRVITFDGRAWQDTPTRFHFHFDPARYPDPKPVIDQLKAQGFRICV